MTTVRGNPDRLEEYTATALPSDDNVANDISRYNHELTALLAAPSTISVGVTDRSWLVSLELTLLRQLDHRPAAFGYALRQLDHFVPDTPRDRTWLTTSDDAFFDALVSARLADPTGSDSDVYNAALDAITGTPQQLAQEFEWVLGDIDDSMSDDDVAAMCDQLQLLMGQIHESDIYSDQPPLTDEQVAQRAFQILHAQWGDDDLVTSDLVDRLADLTSRLSRRRFDSAFTSAFYDALGPDATAQLPRAITLASWSDLTRNEGASTFSVDDALIGVDTALATASPNLGDSFRETLFARATDGDTLRDAFPLLFEYGHYSEAFAQGAGQLGLRILKGEVTVDRGVGSPGYGNFDELETHWEERGTMLLDAASRTPAAATALLLDSHNTEWLTQDDFNHGRHHPSWDVIAPSVSELIVSGTVTNFGADPAHARLAAVNVINGALAEGPGDAAEALAPAYGQMVIRYLPDFALSAGFGTDLTPTVFNGHISLGGYEGSQFLSLAMHDDAARSDIFKLRDILDLQIATAGLEGRLDPSQPDWIQQVANIDGMVLSGANGENVIAAAELDADATAYNENVDFWQNLGMSVIGLKLDIPGPVDVLLDRGLDELKNDFLYHETDHLERTGNQDSEATFNAFDHERLVVAQAQLFVALRAEVAGQTLTTDQRATIQQAEAKLGQPYIDALRAGARGEPVTPPAVDGRVLQEWAGSAPTGNGSLDVIAYTQAIMPYDPRGLW